MNSDDPFSGGDGDRTIIRPNPGGRSNNGGAGDGNRAFGNQPEQQQPIRSQGSNDRSPSQNRPRSNSASYAPSLEKLSGSGLNPLVDISTPLLILASKLRVMPTQDDVIGLRDHVSQQLRIFADKARTAGIDQETTHTARYLLCTFIDESVLGTPWGSESNWASQSLLVTFHNEAWGGEKFFQIMDNLLQSPSRNLNILELIYLCLSFGFKGKYAVSERGSSQIIEAQENLMRVISTQRGDIEHELSPHWRGVKDKRHALVRYVPLWVVAALSGLLLLVIYGIFRLILGYTTAPLYEQIDDARQEPRIELLDE